MDLCLSRDLFESYFLYQRLLSKEFAWMATEYGFHDVDANRMPEQVHQDVQRMVAPLYGAPLSPSRGSPRKPSRAVSPVPRRAAYE